MLGRKLYIFETVNADEGLLDLVYAAREGGDVLLPTP